MRFARDGHVLSHRLDDFDESTPYRRQVGFSSEDEAVKTPRHFDQAEKGLAQMEKRAKLSESKIERHENGKA
jgi:hypothetical protein